LIDLRPDGSYRLNMDYFTYVAGRTMTGDRFARLFGGPGRKPEEPITRRETDLAASIQQVIEEAMLGIAARAHAITKARDLCMAGGVALNCVANGRLHRESPFERIWIQPAAGDAGGSLGAALFVWHQLLENPRTPREQDSQKGSLLGPSYDDDAIAAALRAAQTTAAHFPDEGALLARVAELLDQGMVVGWFHGRAEFGPRALGARSILGDARSAELRSTLNLKIKGRESFRPFAPCVLRERAHELFEVEPDADCPYMLRVASVRPALRLTADAEDGLAQDLDARARVARSTIPAVTHVDFSARVQTVDAERHGRFYRLLKAFERRTGCPALINTSLNVRGEPIVGTPAQALDCFLCTDMDAIVLGDHLVTKDARSRARAAERRQEHLAQFQPD
jgi:carbamoyltransferase